LLQGKDAPTGGSSPQGLTSPRFAGDPLLEECFLGRARLKKGMKGTAVEKVQQALLDLQFDLGPMGADGDFGSRTDAAVKRFKSQQELASPQSGEIGPAVMRRLDELFPAAKPEPGPVFNPELEDKLDVVWLEYQSMFQEQHHMLDRLESDLAAQEGPSHKSTEFLVDAALGAMEVLFGHAAAKLVGIIPNGIIDSLTASEKIRETEKENVAEWGVKPVFEGIADAAKETLKNRIKEDADRASAERQELSAFIDGQQTFLINQTNAAQAGFLEKGKARVRQQPADRQMPQAEGLLETVRKQRLAAAQLQYDQSLLHWSRYIAQAAAGTKPDEVSGRRGTDLRAERRDIRGVLEIQIVGQFPNNESPAARRFVRVILQKATIAGLSEPARNKMAQHLGDVSIEQLNLPVVVHGIVGFGASAGFIRIARNEVGERFNQLKGDFNGNDWLTQRARIAGVPEPSPESGLATVLVEDINPKRVKDIPGGIQKPG
jgi:hypothetical protein